MTEKRWGFTISKRPVGACARCGKDISNGDWIKYCRYYVILNEGIILHFCKMCFERERDGFQDNGHANTAACKPA